MIQAKYVRDRQTPKGRPIGYADDTGQVKSAQAFNFLPQTNPFQCSKTKHRQVALVAIAAIIVARLAREVAMNSPYLS